MPGHRIPTKEQLRLYGSQHPEARRYMELAEAQRKQLRRIQAEKNKAKKRKKADPKKKSLKTTDYLTPKQIAHIESILQAPGGRSRTRADLSRMMIITMIETGLRVSELCDLRWRDLPTFHGHDFLQVINGKGEQDRTVGLSTQLTLILVDYVGKYHIRGGIDNYVFPSEAGGRVSRQAVGKRIKRIGLLAGLWLYWNPKIQAMSSLLSPHKLRHTNATCTLNGSGKLSLVQEQLGHANINTTTLYAKHEKKQRQADLDKASEYAWSELTESLK